MFNRGGTSPEPGNGQGFSGSPRTDGQTDGRRWASCAGGHRVLAWLQAELPWGRQGQGPVARGPRLTAHGTAWLCGRVESAAQRTEVLQGFSRSSSSASSFTSVVEEAEGVDADDTGLVSGSGPMGWDRALSGLWRRFG